MTNRNLLRAKTIEKGHTLVELAKVIGMSNVTMSRKINNKSEFTQSEIKVIKDFLELTDEEVELIFFTTSVDN